MASDDELVIVRFPRDLFLRMAAAGLGVVGVLKLTEGEQLGEWHQYTFSYESYSVNKGDK